MKLEQIKELQAWGFPTIHIIAENFEELYKEFKESNKDKE